MLIRWAEEAMGRDSNRRQSPTLRVICKADGLLVPAVNNARMAPFWGIDSAEKKHGLGLVVGRSESEPGQSRWMKSHAEGEWAGGKRCRGIGEERFAHVGLFDLGLLVAAFWKLNVWILRHYSGGRASCWLLGRWPGHGEWQIWGSVPAGKPQHQTRAPAAQRVVVYGDVYGDSGMRLAGRHTVRLPECGEG